MRFILETERRRVNGDHRKTLLNHIIYLYLYMYIYIIIMHVTTCSFISRLLVINRSNYYNSLCTVVASPWMQLLLIFLLLTISHLSFSTKRVNWTEFDSTCLTLLFFEHFNLHILTSSVFLFFFFSSLFLCFFFYLSVFFCVFLFTALFSLFVYNPQVYERSVRQNQSFDREIHITK